MMLTPPILGYSIYKGYISYLVLKLMLGFSKHSITLMNLEKK